MQNVASSASATKWVFDVANGGKISAFANGTRTYLVGGTSATNGMCTLTVTTNRLTLGYSLNFTVTGSLFVQACVNSTLNGVEFV